jgi:hypothetical protein
MDHVTKTPESKRQDEANIEHDLAAGTTYMPDLNDKAMERRVVRKIDTWILPFVCVSYLINFLDRVRITMRSKLNLTSSLRVAGQSG